MRSAFHFGLSRGSLFTPMEETFFRAALGVGGELHAKLSRGQLIWWGLFDPEGSIRLLADSLLDKDAPRWTTVHPAELEAALADAEIFVVVADGLSRKQTALIDRSFRDQRPPYLGSIEVNLANPVHWAVYRERLPLWSRMVGRELRLLHLAEELEGEQDLGALAHWKSTGLFARVSWEDVGVQGTIFDPYGTFAHQQRVAQLEDMISDRLTGMAGQLLLRLEDLDPRLRDTLYSAFRALSRVEVPEDLSHVATSCRRFLKGLADALYPPRNQPVDGRNVGEEQYRNRLWAYVKAGIAGSSQELILANLKDLGDRIYRFNDLASKGVHADIEAGEVERLLTSLLVVTHDILTLAPPSSVPRLEPYEAEMRRFVQGILEDPREQ